MSEPTCPECGSRNVGAGYGLAGGGIGAYMYCGRCGYIFDKVQDAEVVELPDGCLAVEVSDDDNGQRE